MLITPASLRGRIAELQEPLYRLAARVNYHPTRLGMVLRGRAPLTPDLAQRIVHALDEIAAQQQGTPTA